jgi:hypothetical protein
MRLLKLYDQIEGWQAKEADFSRKSSEEQSVSYQIFFHPDCRNEFWEMLIKDAVLLSLGKISKKPKKPLEAIAALHTEALTAAEKEQSSSNLEMEFLAEVKKRGIRLSELQQSGA